MLRFTLEAAAFQLALQLFFSPEHPNLYQSFTGYEQEGRTPPVMELKPFSTFFITGSYYPTRGRKTSLKG